MKEIDQVFGLKINDRVKSLVTGSVGTIVGFRYCEIYPAIWHSEPIPGQKDSEDSFDVKWDNGKESFGCFTTPNIQLIEYSDLVEENKNLKAELETLKAELKNG